MLKNKHLKDWSSIVSQRMNHLSLPQVAGLATWSFGMVMTKSSSLTQVSNFIAKVNGEKPNTVRQRLKEWYQEAEARNREKAL
jgi:hypoxanthine phosphoribosyltransferase